MSQPGLQEQVESLCDRVAADLLDRTGTELTIPQFADLAKKLAERIGDLVSDLCRGVPSHPAQPIGRDDAYDGEESVLNGPDSESRR